MLARSRFTRRSRLLDFFGLAIAVGCAPIAVADPMISHHDDVVTIVVVGDVGLNASHLPVDPTGIFKDEFQPWSDTTVEIEADINGDLNFLNLETIVTDRNDLIPDRKGQIAPLNFRMHPEGLRHLVSKGFNLISLANNHSMDYGVAGLEETLRHVAKLRGQGILAATGIGMNREQASRPEIFNIKGNTIAFSAMGIVTNDLGRHRAGPDRPGQIAYRFTEDFREVLRRLAEPPAALRILSIHYGYEGLVRADARQLAEWRGEAALRAGIDLVVGHHAHAVRGVELAGRSLIFYGLGNFLHHGPPEIIGNDICRNYGLMVRVHLRKGAAGRLEIRAVEAIPVTDTHYRPRRLPAAEGGARVHALNYLAATLDDSAGKARGVRFTPRPDGSGLYCLPGAENDPGSIATLCHGFTPAPPIPADLQSRIAASCRR